MNRLLTTVKLSLTFLAVQSLLSVTALASESPAKVIETPRTNGSGLELVTPFQFGDGNWESLSWRGVEETLRPSSNFGPQIDDVKERVAQGDRNSAYLLFQILSACEPATLAKSDLDSQLEELRTTGFVEISGVSQTVDVLDEESIGKLTRYMTRLHENCKSLTNEEINDRESMLAMAADGGPGEATILYSSRVSSAQAIPLLERSWTSGNMDALAKLYRHQLVTHQDGSDPDALSSAYKTAFAYATLYEQLLRTYEIDGAEYLSAVKSEIDMIGASMSDDDVAQAKSDAINLIRANKNCCFAR